MAALLQQNASLLGDLVRDRVITDGDPVAEISGWASIFTETAAFSNAAVSFNGDGDIGLAFTNQDKLYRAVAAGAWTPTDVEDLFGVPDGQLIREVRFGSGDNAVAAGVHGNDAWFLYSSDGGATWTETATDLSALTDTDPIYFRAASKGASTFVVIGRDPTDTYQFLASRSTDGGATWTIANGPAIGAIQDASRVRYDAQSDRWFAVTQGGYSISENNGATWTALAAPPGTGVCFIIDVVRMSSTTLIGVGCEDLSGTPTAGIWLSGDDGDTWTKQTVTGIVGTDSPVILSTCQNVGEGVIVISAFAPASTAVMYSTINGAALTHLPDSVPIGPTLVPDVEVGFGLYHLASNDFSLAGTTGRLTASETIVVTVPPAYTEGNITKDDGLTSYVNICLLCDARDPDEDQAQGDRRGYWAAAYLGEDWGSLLWKLRGAPNTPENLKTAEEYAVAALKGPMVRDGLASDVRASAAYHPTEWCRLKIEIRSGRGLLTQWRTVWENTLNGLVATNS